MELESIRILLQKLLEENPKILKEVLADHQKNHGKLERPQTIRLTPELKERIQKLNPKKRGQAAVIRRALEIGLSQLEE